MNLSDSIKGEEEDDENRKTFSYTRKFPLPPFFLGAEAKQWSEDEN